MAKTDVEGFETKSCLDYTPQNLGFTGDHNQAFSLDFCRSTNYDPDDYAKCCFVKLELNDHRLYHCYPITLAEWADIEIAEDKIEKIYDLESIDCSSSYLFMSLLLLLSLLF